MTVRYFCSSSVQGSLVTLGDAEAHHLLHVMRASVGDEVVVFDGSGYEYAARVVRTKRSEVELEVVARHDVSRELTHKVVVGVSLPKGERQRWLVEKLTELGVAELVPLETARSVARPESGALDRLRKTVIEASKQCGRNRLMEIAAAQPPTSFFRAAPVLAMRLFAHPLPEKVQIEWKNDSPARPAVYLAIGPEGGWTEQEVNEARDAGWQAVGLGASILRTETAAVALAARAALPF